MDTAAAVRDARGYLSFRLGGEEYALDILKVREIRNYERATAIATAPKYVKGVIDLRGVVVPIFDLRTLLGFEGAEYTPFTVVIVLDVGGRTVGIVVDAVSDVVHLDPSQVRPAPELSGRMDARYVSGLGAVDDRLLILADMESLLALGDGPREEATCS